MRWLYVLSLLALAATSAHADQRSARPPFRDEVDIQEFPGGLLPVDRGEFAFMGTVYDWAREPMPGIQVKLFVGGFLENTFVTDSVGQFDFKHTIDFSPDESVMLWFVDPTHTVASKAFVLKESNRSREAGILSACLTRLRVEKKMESTVYLFDRATKAKLIAQQQCL